MTIPFPLGRRIGMKDPFNNPYVMFNEEELAGMRLKVEWMQDLAAAIIVSGIKDEDWEWLESEACQELCDFIELGFTAEELVARLKKVWPINFFQSAWAVLKQLRELDA